jgi:hypothetical protein
MNPKGKPSTGPRRAAVVEFMPYSFAAVNKMSKRFLEAERRHNYTTPKTFLELIKLYKSVLARKRKATQEAIDRLENGLAKLHKTQSEVDVLVESAKKMAVEVEHKVASANVFAEQVRAPRRGTMQGFGGGGPSRQCQGLAVLLCLEGGPVCSDRCRALLSTLGVAWQGAARQQAAPAAAVREASTWTREFDVSGAARCA